MRKWNGMGWDSEERCSGSCRKIVYKLCKSCVRMGEEEP
jgi:hypothetical protein